MDDLIPTIMVCPDYFKNKWEVRFDKKNETVWTALVDDARMGVIDQHNKEHSFVFKKGAKITQRIVDQKLLMTYNGLKKIEYNND